MNKYMQLTYKGILLLSKNFTYLYPLRKMQKLPHCARDSRRSRSQCLCVYPHLQNEKITYQRYFTNHKPGFYVFVNPRRYDSLTTTCQT